ncbi:MAG TPA: L-histidine N(alpha)-methyltransferase [Bryobacteraceae bacterium]|nr:L-histidine N(alpha)-methyltransferase [Bryobacteraceae bacterium]
MATTVLTPLADPAFARDVAEGLAIGRRKTLPPSWLYDEVGSALFEVITLLPEYGLTRADAALLARYSRKIVEAAGSPRAIAELGSGTGTKTRHILEAAAPARYFPVDISASALQQCEAALGSMDGIRIKPIEASYLDGIGAVLEERRKNEPILVLFLGSTIGNFNRAEASAFLRNLRARLLPGDTLLLGADLVKPKAKLLKAYDDDAGVTAAFNLNLLARINRELGGNFEVRQFVHEARYNDRQSRVEMHLRSKIAQTVRIEALELTVPFAAGETIWTESSHKFEPEDIRQLGEDNGWSAVEQWFDRDWGFAETLFELR